MKKITISASMHFSKEMLEAKKKLEEIGFECFLPVGTEECVKNPGLNEDYEFCSSNDVLMDHYNNIEKSDAVIVLNYPKNGTDGYIGGAVLMEIAVTKFLNKKLFLLFDIPDEKTNRHAFEVKLTKPTILNGDILKVKNYL